MKTSLSQPAFENHIENRITGVFDAGAVKKNARAFARVAGCHSPMDGQAHVQVYLSGTWWDSEEYYVSLRGTERMVQKIGRKYFHTKIRTEDGMETVRLKRCRDGSTDSRVHIREGTAGEFTKGVGTVT